MHECFGNLIRFLVGQITLGRRFVNLFHFCGDLDVGQSMCVSSDTAIMCAEEPG
jgi:hypothetical protein